eukprot:1184513-Prorocentrum_minimum.AAC.3
MRKSGRSARCAYSGFSTCAAGQSGERREHIPGAGANREPRGESIYPEREPIGSRSRERREHIPGAEANRVREESIYPEREPLAREERAYTRSGSQSGAERREPAPFPPPCRRQARGRGERRGATARGGGIGLRATREGGGWRARGAAAGRSTPLAAPPPPATRK